MSVISSILLSAGKGSRMKMKKSKQLLELLGKPLIYYSIDKFHKNKNIDEIILVIRKEEETEIKDILNEYNLWDKVRIVHGGKERYNSVKNGLLALDEKSDIVLIHDGARPFITDEIINENIEKSKVLGSSITAVKLKDTIKKIDKNGKIENTPNRELFIIAQTPQTFHTKEILKAYNGIENLDSITDDSMLMEKLGYVVEIVEGSYENIKITTREDLVLGEIILKKRIENENRVRI